MCIKENNRMKLNRVTAIGVKGIYKDKFIEVIIDDYPKNCVVKVDGKKVDNCAGVYIKLLPDRFPVMTLNFVKIPK
jgi:hypothetical protein